MVRSVVMFSLLAFAGLQPEKPLTLNTLAATAFLMLLCKPVWLFDVGFSCHSQRLQLLYLYSLSCMPFGRSTIVSCDICGDL